jgi:hypothetical protein
MAKSEHYDRRLCTVYPYPRGMAKPEHTTSRVFSQDGEEINKDSDKSTDAGH